MQVECIRPFGHHKPGDVAEVPDGASVDPAHWRPVEPHPVAAGFLDGLSRPQPEVSAALAGLAEKVIPAKEGM